jgi:signal transduction histidine kinase
MRHQSFHRQKPKWWPDNEIWPPIDRREIWRRTPRRFFFRIGGMLFIALLLVCGLLALIWSLIGGFVVTLNTPLSSLSPLNIILIIIVIGILSNIGRAVRRSITPIADLMEASGRVADGDYSIRVKVRGAREVRELVRSFNAMAEHLQTNEELRRNMLADVTHELRTPLTVMQGNLEGMLDGVYPLDRDRIESILSETRLLARVIDDLRTLALSESGALKLQKESTDLGDLINQTMAAFRPQAGTAGIAVSTEVAPALPAIEIDPARIREVLENLIANALHYTPRAGSIQIKCESANQQVSVSISDSGQGIAAEDLPHIFDRFYKGSDSRGTGLGLAIAKTLIAAHGGEIFAESEVGRGTTIRFVLPMLTT